MFNNLIIEGIIENLKGNKAIIKDEKYRVIFKEGTKLNKGDSIKIEGQLITEDNKQVIIARNIISSELNRSIMLGRLGDDPQIRYTQGGKAVCNFSLATDVVMEENKTEWIPVVCFEKQAENCSKYLKKGSLVLVSGYLKIETWQDKDKNDREIYKIIANRVQFISTSQADKK